MMDAKPNPEVTAQPCRRPPAPRIRWAWLVVGLATALSHCCDDGDWDHGGSEVAGQSSPLAVG